MPFVKNQFVNEIAPGDEVNSLFLVGRADLGTARNGPYWRLELKDSSGAIEAKIWSPLSLNFTEISSGSLVEAGGRASVYKDKVEINLERLFILPEEDAAGVDMADFLLCSAVRPEIMHAELLELCRRVLRHSPWKKLVLGLLNDEEIKNRLMLAPAAKGVHHAYCGGLLEHTLGVARLCMLLADAYPELDRQLLLAGAILHDMGKLWELQSGAATDYTDAGRLLGHIELGLEMLGPHLCKSGLEPELALHLKHLILSHHGELEFGSPKRPKTPEAFVLHCADNLDAKLAQFREVFAAMPEDGPNWSPFQKTLERYLDRANATPINEKTGARGPKKEADDSQLELQATQCSLLLKE